MRRPHTAVNAVVLGTGVLALAPVPEVHAQDYSNGEIIMISRDTVDGNVYYVQRVDPETMAVSTLQTLSYPTTAAFPDEAITYCAHRDRIIVPINNWPRRIVEIDSAGNTTTIQVTNPLGYNISGFGKQAARGDGKVYFNGNSMRLWYYDENYVIHELTDAGGVPFDMNYGNTQSATAMYFHEPSNSLYLDRGKNFGSGIDEDYIYRVQLNTDGTQFTGVTTVRVDLAPGNLDQVHSIGPGRTDSEIAFTMTTNDANVGDITDMLNVNSFSRERFLTAEFAVAGPGGGCSGVTHSSNSLEVGVYSALAGGDGFGRFVYPVEITCSATQNTVELWSYEYGDVDTSGLTADQTAAGNDFGVQNLLVIENRPCNEADLNADGILDLTDINVFVNAFVNQQPAGDINGDGVWDLTDLNEFITAFFLGIGC